MVAESRQGRTIVGRLDRGADLVTALLSICRARKVRAGELRAIGSLEAVEIAEYDQATRVYRPARRFQSPFEILALSGNVSDKDGQLFLHAHITLSRERDNGIEVIGGHLLSGRVFACEFTLNVWDDLVLARSADPATGLSLWQEASPSIAPAATPAPSSPPSPASFEAAPRGRIVESSAIQAPRANWSDVIARSAEQKGGENEPGGQSSAGAEESAVESAEELPAPGDVLLHPTFGRCVVERVEGDGEFASVRLRNQRLVRLSLDIFHVELAGSEDGRRVLRARVK